VQNKQPSFKPGIKGKLHFRTLNYSRYNVHCLYNRSLHTSSPFFNLLQNEPATILICQFVPMSVKSIRSMYGIIFVRNGAKAYVKNPQVFFKEKSAKRGFMKSSRHPSTASGKVYFFSLGEQIKIFDRAPLQAQKQMQKCTFSHHLYR
jgi:hypothetical protein